jgi:hypothetical protein
MLSVSLRVFARRFNSCVIGALIILTGAVLQVYKQALEEEKKRKLPRRSRNAPSTRKRRPD